MPTLTKSEKKILAKIRKTMLYTLGQKYMFWFIYDDSPPHADGIATGWEGGYDMSLTQQFRNEYTIEKNKSIVKNW